MKKIKLVYNLLGKWGPANNAAEPDEDLLRFVNDNTYSTKGVESQLLTEYSRFSELQ